MTASLLRDFFDHHVWANGRLLEACAGVTDEQLQFAAPGTYGTIAATLHHIVQADSFYLMLLTHFRVPLIDKEVVLPIADLRAANDRHARDYREYLATDPDPDEDLPERDEQGSFHATLGIRIGQAIHHGTDHRSQVCTALTMLGIQPPMIEVWDFGEATGKTFSVPGEAV